MSLCNRQLLWTNSFERVVASYSISFWFMSILFDLGCSDAGCICLFKQVFEKKWRNLCLGMFYLFSFTNVCFCWEAQLSLHSSVGFRLCLCAIDSYCERIAVRELQFRISMLILFNWMWFLHLMKWILPLPVFPMAGGRAAASAATVSLRERLPSLASIYKNAGSGYASREWISGLLALPAGGLVDITKLY